MKKAIIVCIILLFLMEIFFMVNMVELKAVSGQGILDSTIQSSQGYYEIISKYGTEGLNIYSRIRKVDMLFPLIYGILLILLLRKTHFKFYLLPIIASVADISENLLIGRMLKLYPEQLDVGLLLSTLIVIKFTVISVSFLIFLVRRKK